MTGENYGALKALAEQEAQRTFAGRATIVRPGLIVGPGDPSDRFTYWPVRIARGGEVRAPGDGSDPVQFSDARDLAEWCVRMVEQNADVIVDHPTDDFPNGNAYVSAVYTKAPLGFHALHMAMGDDVFFEALQEYVDTFRFRVATPADLEAILQAHTDADIREIWSHWFERREGGLDIRGAVPVWIG